MRGAIAAFVVPLTAFRELLATGLLGGHSNEGQGSGPTAFPDAGDRSSRTGGGGKKMELRHPTTFRAVAWWTRTGSSLPRGSTGPICPTGTAGGATRGGPTARTAPHGAGLGRRRVHERVPRVGRRKAGVAGRGTTPSRPAIVTLRLGEEAARVSGAAEEVWVVERTFAWLGLSRRFSKYYERLPETAEAMIYGALSRIMPRRLRRAA